MPRVVNSSDSSPFWLCHCILMRQNRKICSKKSAQNVIYMTFSYYKGMHKLKHFFMIYSTNKCVNLHIALWVICVGSSFATLINHCQGSKLQGQGLLVKMSEGPVLPCPCGSYSPKIITMIFLSKQKQIKIIQAMEKIARNWIGIFKI